MSFFKEKFKNFLEKGKEFFFFYPQRFAHFKKIFITLFLFISILPLTILTALSYYKYKNLIKEDTFKQTYLYTYNTRQTIESYINQLKYAIILISELYNFEELSNQKNLDQVFDQLKKKYEGLVDLSVIGPDGIQVAYSGPFHLKGKDYSEAFWYQKVLVRGVFVSEVFLGYRKLPHFIIAVSRKMKGKQQYWVLRASIDKETLDRFLHRIKTEEIYNAFLISENKEIQSSILNLQTNASSIIVPAKLPLNEKDIVLEEIELENKKLVRAIGKIEGTPWFLVLDQYGYTHRLAWTMFVEALFAIYLVSILILIPISIYLGVLLTRMVKKFEKEREAALVKAEHADKLASIGRLSAGIAHEINNPLAIINEKVGLMKDILNQTEDFPYKDKFLRQIDAIEKAVQRGKNIIHRLLGFTKRITPQLEPVKINEVIEECLSFLEKEATYHNIRFEKDFQPDLPTIIADYGQLQQVFLNLINNAIDAIIEAKREEGVIKLKTSCLNKNYVQVIVEDNGIGMSSEIKKKIFEPFFSTKLGRDKSGTGLGLFITYGIVKKFGGEILVESEVGKGSTFKIIFPINPKFAGGFYYEKS